MDHRMLPTNAPRATLVATATKFRTQWVRSRLT